MKRIWIGLVLLIAMGFAGCGDDQAVLTTNDSTESVSGLASYEYKRTGGGARHYIIQAGKVADQDAVLVTMTKQYSDEKRTLTYLISSKEGQFLDSFLETEFTVSTQKSDPELLGGTWVSYHLVAKNGEESKGNQIELDSDVEAELEDIIDRTYESLFD